MSFGQKWLKKRSLVAWIGILILLLASVISDYSNAVSGEDLVEKAEKQLQQKEEEVNAELEKMFEFIKTKQPRDLFVSFNKEHKKLYEKKGIVFLVYQNDSLLYWSDHSAGVEEYLKEVCLDNNLAKLKNGFFEVIRHPGNKSSSYQLMGLVLLKSEFSYQNKYLINRFQADFGLPAESELFETKVQDAYPIKNSYKQTIAYVKIPEGLHKLNWLTVVSSLLYFITFFLLINLIRKEYFKFKDTISEKWLYLLYSLTVFALRFLMILNHFPSVLYETGLYDPSIYGNANSFWFGYLGDVLINVGLFFYLALLAQKHLVPKVQGKVESMILTLLSFSALLLFALLIEGSLYSLIENSSISFNVNNIFSLNEYSFACFIIAALFYFTFYLFADLLMGYLYSLKKYALLNVGIVITLCVGFSLVQLMVLKSDPIVSLWPSLLLLILAYTKSKKLPYSFSYGIIFILLFSFFTAHVFLKNEAIKETETRKVYAERLANQQDEVAENLFVDIDKKIKHDSKLRAQLFQKPFVPLEIEQRIRQVYLSGYWERFNISVSVMDSACRPLIKTANPLHENNTYFDEQINYNGIKTTCEDLYFIEGLEDRTRYIARIPIEDKQHIRSKPVILYFEIEPKLIPDAIGFPELLLDKSVKTNNLLADYSYAIYKNNRLVLRSGKYPFNFQYSWNAAKKDFVLFDENDFTHLIYHYDKATKVIVSKETIDYWGKFTTNSYFFLFFSVLLWIFLYLREWNARKKMQSSSLNIRIQLLLVSVVLISLVAFGIGTFIFINRQFEEKNIYALDEKIKSVLQELQGSLGENETLEQNYKEYTGYILKKLSVVFGTDINMYDLKGNIFATSQPKLFDEGIISKKMNPDAYNNIISSRFINFVIRENIGKLNYHSAYQPFYSKNGKLLSYVNLPYFARQGDLEKEISVYIVALINIYVILFAFSTLAALFISNLVTRPLRIIQQRLSKVRLGKRNETIHWNDNDEIGSLVNEYNRMIEQLEESADKLARSERESAWREMAKQVAHEIKNPLTPMKLNIQHLERIIEGNPEDLKERVKKLSALLVEQIDTLSNIAGEFSSFAKMPKANLEVLCINQQLRSVTDLFAQSLSIPLKVNDTTGRDVMVFADKDQLIRVFTNLLKNAQQAIPEGKEGLIEVNLSLKNKNVVVMVKDNGTGIAPEVMDKIFTPNFSTKTEGMGLGLAIVKNSVESFQGSIWFETARNVGTSFFVSLPIKD